MTGVLEIQVGDTKNLLTSFEEINAYFDNTLKKIEEVKRSESFADAIGGDKKAYRDVQKQLAEISVSFATTFKRIKKASQEESLKDVLGGEDGIEQINRFSKVFSSAVKTVDDKVQESVAGIRLANIEYDRFYESLEESINSVSMNAEKYLVSAILSEDADAFESAIKRAESSADEINDAYRAMARAQKISDASQRSLTASVIAGVASYEELKDAVDASKKGSMALTVSQAREAKSIDFLKERLVEIEVLYRRTNDPEIKKALIAEYERENELLKEQEETLEKQRELRKSMRIAETGKRDDTITQAGQKLTSIFNALTGIVSQAESATMNVDDLRASIASFNETAQVSEKPLSEFLKGLTESTEAMQMTFLTASEYSDKVVGFAESLSGMSMSLAEFGVNSVGTSALLSKSAMGASGALASLSTAVVTLAPPIMAVGAAVAVFVAGMKMIDRVMGTSAEQIQKRVEAIESDIEATRTMNALIRQGSVDALEAKQQQIRDTIAQRKEERQARLDAIVQTTSYWNQLRTIVNSALGDDYVFGETAETIREMTGEIESLESKLETLQDNGIRVLVERLEYLNEISSQARNALSDYEKREQELIDIRVDADRSLEQVIKDLSDAQAEYDNDTQELLRKRQAENREMYAEHLDKLSEIESEYQGELEDARRDFLRDIEGMELSYARKVLDARDSLISDLDDFDREYKENEREAEANYRESELEAQEYYRESVLEAEEDFNEQRIQRQKDLLDQLFEAELANDALRYFQLKRDAKKEEKEAKDEFKEQMDEERLQYEEERAEAKKQYEEERAEARQQYEQENIEKQIRYEESIADLHTQMQEELAILRTGYQDQQNALRQAMQERQVELANQYEAEKNQRALARAEEDRDRATRLATRRAELADQFALEQEYFREREQLLIDYVTDFRNNVTTYQDMVQSALRDGYIDIAESGEFARLVDTELRAMRAEAERRGVDITGSEVYQSLSGLLDQLRGVQTTGQSISVEAINFRELDRLIENEINRSAVEIGNAYSDAFKFTSVNSGFDTLGYNATQSAIALDTASSAIGRMIAPVQEIVSTFGLVRDGSGGLLTPEEEQERQRAIRLARQSEDLRSIEFLRSQAEEQNDIIRQTSERDLQIISQSEADRYNRIQERIRQEGVLTTEDMDARLSRQEEHYRDGYAVTDYYLSDTLGLETTYNRNVLSQRTDTNQTLEREDTQSNKNRLREQSGYFTESESITSNSLQQQLQTVEASEREIAEVRESETENLMRNLRSETTVGFMMIQREWQTGLANMRRATTAQNSAGGIFGGLTGQYQSARDGLSGLFGGMFGYGTAGFGETGTLGTSSYSGLMNNNSTTASGGLRGIFAAEGLYTEKEQLAVIGEDDSEIVIPFDKSRGLPDNILESMGSGLARGLRRNPDLLPERDMRTPVSSPQITNKTEYRLDFGNISVGGDMSRAEIETYFRRMQDAIIEVVYTSTQSGKQPIRSGGI